MPIKFRAKPNYACHKQWVYGGYYCVDDRHFIVDEHGVHWHVRGETVGQFTGLLDKNGKEVYENDILQVLSSMKATVVFRDGEFVMDYHSKTTQWNDRLIVWQKDIEVIGNIHEEAADVQP